MLFRDKMLVTYCKKKRQKIHIFNMVHRRTILLAESTPTYLIPREALINGEGGKIGQTGRVENLFYYIKNHVEAGIFLKT